MAIKMKRGTTQEWTFGPELIQMENSPTNGKDSIIHMEGTNIKMYVYTESANEWYINDPHRGNSSKTDGKISGLPIALYTKEYDDSKHYRLCVDYSGPSDCALEMVYAGNLIQHDFSIGAYIVQNYHENSVPELFMKWPAEQVGITPPEAIHIRISLREVGAYDELEEGQLGIELTPTNELKLKAGLPGRGNQQKWNNLPYIGHIEVDTELDAESSNPISNSAVTAIITQIGGQHQTLWQQHSYNGYEFYIVKDNSPTAITWGAMTTWRHFLKQYTGNHAASFGYTDQGQVTYQGVGLVYGSPVAHSAYAQGNEVWLDETILPYHGYFV